MSYVRSKVISGHTYYYEVEGHRDKDGKVKQKVIKYLGKSKPDGKGEMGLGTTETFKERKIKDGLVSSEKETLGEGSLDWVRSAPGSGQVLWGIGEENVINEIDDTHEIYYEKTDNRIYYKTILTESNDGKSGRILMVKSKRVGPETPSSDKIITKDYKSKDGDAGLLWRKIDGKPTIIDINVADDSRGKGLGGATVKQFLNQYGEVRVTGPYSKQGKKLMQKYPEGIEVIR